MYHYSNIIFPNELLVIFFLTLFFHNLECYNIMLQSLWCSHIFGCVFDTYVLMLLLCTKFGHFSGFYCHHLFLIFFFSLMSCFTHQVYLNSIFCLPWISFLQENVTEFIWLRREIQIKMFSQSWPDIYNVTADNLSDTVIMCIKTIHFRYSVILC